MKLKNKIAVVTGSRRGIGRAIALEFARQGAHVVVTDIALADCKRVCREIESLGRQALAVKCDVSSKKDVDLLVKRSLKTFGRIDILINNAGIYRTKPLSKTTEREWDRIIDVNLKSVFLCTKAMVDHVTSIVNIASIAGKVGFGDSSAYCASKGGIIALTKELALELAPRVRVNAIGPGPIRTPMTKFIEQDPKTKKSILSQIPLGRMGEPEEIAKVAAFLASEDASFVTGHCIFADGGWVAR